MHKLLELRALHTRDLQLYMTSCVPTNVIKYQRLGGQR